MATSRSSNLSRAAYRTRCRKILSEHICEIRPTAVERILLTKTRAARLGISIEPAEVRLITGADDPYAWQALPEKNHIFQKQLSKHSVGVYTEMCREVGVSFEAVPAPESKTAAERSPIEGTQRMLPVSSKTSFTSVIQQLKAEKVQPTFELDDLRNQVEEARQSKGVAEEETDRLKRLMQTAEEDKQTLQQEVHNMTGVIESLRTTALQSADELINRLRLDLNRVRDKWGP